MSATSAALVVPRGLPWTLIGTFINAACQWLAIVTVARLGTPETLGHYSYALAVCAPLVMLARLNMRTVLATDIKARYRFDDYFVARLVLVAIATVLVLGYAFAADPGAVAITVLAGTLAYKNAESIADVVHGLLQRDEKFAVMGKSTVLRGLSLLACLAFGLAVCHNLAVGLGLVTIAWVAIFLAYDCTNARKGATTWFRSDAGTVIRLARECLPSGLVMMVSSLSVNLPVYVVASVLGAEQVGYYATVAYLLTVGGLSAAAVSQASAAHMARLYFSDRRAYWRQLTTFMAGSIALSSVAVGGVLLFGRQVLVLLYGEEYGHLDGALLWIAVAAGLTFAGSFLGLTLTIARRFYHDLASSVISAAAVGGVLLFGRQVLVLLYGEEYG
ncbi:MAG: oligosaccharide flippase family protein, partial [Pseudomonadota bacterium]|nr:oligosaccharide flippase family protein [Pseudomonadota bacterium]